MNVAKLITDVKYHNYITLTSSVYEKLSAHAYFVRCVPFKHSQVTKLNADCNRKNSMPSTTLVHVPPHNCTISPSSASPAIVRTSYSILTRLPFPNHAIYRRWLCVCVCINDERAYTRLIVDISSQSQSFSHVVCQFIVARLSSLLCFYNCELFRV